MHSASSLWLVAPLMSLVVGVILVSQGLWRSTQRNSAGRGVSDATIFRVRAVLLSMGLFLTVTSAVLAFGFIRR
jgi:hypothetical protein